MIELSVIRDLVAIFGVIAGFTYYVLTVRTNQKNQEISLRNQELTLRAQEQASETRQAQFFMSVYRDHVTKENISDWTEMVQQWEWTDNDDYMKKYGGVHKSNAMFGAYMNRLEGLGVLVKRGLIDVNLLYDLQYGSIILMWEKFQPIINERRRRINAPHLYKDVEYLYDEMIRIRDERGDKKIIPQHKDNPQS